MTVEEEEILEAISNAITDLEAARVEFVADPSLITDARWRDRFGFIGDSIMSIDSSYTGDDAP